MPRTGHWPSAISLSLTALAVLTACGDAENVALGPILAQGTYVLESVSGRGPASGTMLLSLSGAAERRVRYAPSSGGLSAEYVARGTFRLTGGGDVTLELRENDGQSPYVWRPRATLSGDVLRLRHPDPADGPDIVESYRRQ
jgi:hypothetical protein